MEGWDTLRRAIPDGAAKAVAMRLGVTANHVRRWRREPLSDDAPLATGQRSPLDRIVELLDAVFLVSPAGAAFIVDHVAGHHHHLIQASLDPEHWDKRAHTAELLRETVDAVNALNLDASDADTLQELREARVAIDQAIEHIQTRRFSNGAREERQEASGPVRSGIQTGPRGGKP
jgi:hypothetical protein